MSARSTRRAAERAALKTNLNNSQAPTNATAASETTVPPSSEETPEISAARLAANRANAQHSSGPKSPAGKAAVRLNAIKTGLTGVTVLLPQEDAAQYQSHILAYEQKLKPVGPEERALVQSIADLRWRLNRIPALEIAMITVFSRECANPDPQLADQPEINIVLEAEIRYKHEKEFRNLHLQEARLARRREREIKELFALQEQRRVQDGEDLQQATIAFLLAKQHKQRFNLAALGFEFSKEWFARHLAILDPPHQFQEDFTETAESTQPTEPAMKTAA